MAFFDQAQEMLSQGIDTARGAVSGVAMEQLGFVRGFVRLCNDGWEQGWHERNGGNLSYRLRPEDVDTARKFFDKEPRPWTPLGVEAPTMGGAYFLVTGTGNYMRNVASDPSRNIGIVELSATGDAYRIVWGLDDGGRPTSEFPTHVMNHAVRSAATDGACRVIYHAHPTNIIALSYLLPLDARTFTRVLWKAMTECVVVFPAGVDGARRRRHRPGHLRADEDLRRGGMGEPRPVRLRHRLRCHLRASAHHREGRRHLRARSRHERRLG